MAYVDLDKVISISTSGSTYPWDSPYPATWYQLGLFPKENAFLWSDGFMGIMNSGNAAINASNATYKLLLSDYFKENASTTIKSYAFSSDITSIQSSTISYIVDAQRDFETSNGTKSWLLNLDELPKLDVIWESDWTYGVGHAQGTTTLYIKTLATWDVRVVNVGWTSQIYSVHIATNWDIYVTQAIDETCKRVSPATWSVTATYSLAEQYAWMASDATYLYLGWYTRIRRVILATGVLWTPLSISTNRSVSMPMTVYNWFLYAPCDGLSWQADDIAKVNLTTRASPSFINPTGLSVNNYSKVSAFGSYLYVVTGTILYRITEATGVVDSSIVVSSGSCCNTDGTYVYAWNLDKVSIAAFSVVDSLTIPSTSFWFIYNTWLYVKGYIVDLTTFTLVKETSYYDNMFGLDGNNYELVYWEDLDTKCLFVWPGKHCYFTRNGKVFSTTDSVPARRLHSLHLELDDWSFVDITDSLFGNITASTSYEVRENATYVFVRRNYLQSATNFYYQVMVDKVTWAVTKRDDSNSAYLSTEYLASVIMVDRAPLESTAFSTFTLWILTYSKEWNVAAIYPSTVVDWASVPYTITLNGTTIKTDNKIIDVFAAFVTETIVYGSVPSGWSNVVECTLSSTAASPYQLSFVGTPAGTPETVRTTTGTRFNVELTV